MEGQVPASQQPDLNLGRAAVTPENIESLKEEARRRAIMQAMQERQSQQSQEYPDNVPQVQYRTPAPQPQVVYVRRNLTVAELGLLLLLSIGILAGFQFTWNFSTDILSRIEIREK
jgi:hypothetical protein|tara:strand:- start:2083 stop:2430 length:348 start_codon:yes stop_codon:yes gene_type:complete